MKVKCRANTGAGLMPVTISNIGDTAETQYPLKIGEIYTVYGQGILRNVLKYLIVGTYENLPSWYPAELFEVEDSQIYFEWHYKYDKDFVTSALWGYHEMVNEKNHYVDLIEREDQAIRIFLKRKKEIDEFN
ncbi:MAG: phosphoribosylaminoimidazole synthetase [Firmicutes bacterium]|nr:phosphoribosylaminoimidazole synthetase [Bacillota bacterium]